MNFRRALTWAGLIALIAFGLLWPAVFFGALRNPVYGDPVRFTDYHADYTVDADGRLSAVETITGRFPPGRHGIVRAFDDANTLAPHTRQLPSDLTAAIDGAPAAVVTSWQDSTTYLARIGDPDHSLFEGPHVVVIRYRVDGVLDPGGTGAGRVFQSTTGDQRDASSVFLWNVVPSWNNDIDHARVSVTLPRPPLGAGCSVGTGARERRCVVFTAEGNTLRIEANDVEPHSPISVRAGVDVPTPARLFVPWSPRFDAVLGRRTGALLWPALLTLTAVIGTRLWLRRTRDGSIPTPVQHQPPEGLGPAQWDYLRTLRVGPDALTATLLHLAANDLVTLTETDGGRWTVTGIADGPAWSRVDGVSRGVAADLRLTRPGEVLHANGTREAGRRLARARAGIDTAITSWADRLRLVTADRRGDAIILRWCGVVAALVALVLFTRWPNVPTVWGLPFASVFLLSIPAWSAVAGVRRTEAGRELASKAMGFHRFLATESAETRYDFAGRSGLYVTYLPYAVAAAVAPRWAAKFAAVRSGAAEGTTETEQPWARLGSVTSGGTLGLVGLQTAVSASLDSYTPSSSGGSSGGYGSGDSSGGYGGGGDFGGGGGGGDFGGGGGGGGSW